MTNKTNIVRFPAEAARPSPAQVSKYAAAYKVPDFIALMAMKQASEIVSRSEYAVILDKAAGDAQPPAPAADPDPARYMPAYCDPDNEVKGARYEETKGMDIKDVAKILRKQIREAIKSGDLPRGLKTSVRIDRYAGGQSLDVRVTQLPEGLEPYTDEYAIATKGYSQPADYPLYDLQVRPKAVAEILEKLEAMRKGFNRDNSDSMVDYFDVRYYGDTSIAWELESKYKAAQVEKLKSKGLL